jgi:hypothetical protein
MKKPTAAWIETPTACYLTGALPVSRTGRAIDGIVADLRATGKARWTRAEVLHVIKAAGLRPWRTLDRMAGVGGPLRFVGTCRNDGHFVLENRPEK